MTMTTNRDARTELHATAGAVVAQLRDKLRAVEACENLLGADALQTTEARALFDRVMKTDAHDTEELQALLGKLHVSVAGRRRARSPGRQRSRRRTTWPAYRRPSRATRRPSGCRSMRATRRPGRRSERRPCGPVV